MNLVFCRTISTISAKPETNLHEKWYLIIEQQKLLSKIYKNSPPFHAKEDFRSKVHSPEPWESRRAVNPIIISLLEFILLIQDLEVIKFPMGKMEF